MGLLAVKEPRLNMRLAAPDNSVSNSVTCPHTHNQASQVTRSTDKSSRAHFFPMEGKFI